MDQKRLRKGWEKEREECDPKQDKAQVQRTLLLGCGEGGVRTGWYQMATELGKLHGDISPLSKKDVEGFSEKEGCDQTCL